jgi:hypothetical protein
MDDHRVAADWLALTLSALAHLEDVVIELDWDIADECVNGLL